MSIHDAFNDIAEAQGGTASTDGTIIGAIDALTDALAGEDAERAKSIEGAIRMMGQYIGGSSNGGYDAVIRLVHTDNSSADTKTSLTPSIVSGTFADLAAKLEENVAPVILIEYYHGLYGSGFSMPTVVVNSYTPGTSMPNVYLLLFGYFDDGTGIDFRKLDEQLIWTAEDQLTWQ